MNPTDIILMSASTAVILAGLWFTSAEYRHFRSDDRNPHRRYCVKCGQRHDRYGWNMVSGPEWWEAIGPIKDRSCSCHRYTEDGGKWLRD